MNLLIAFWVAGFLFLLFGYISYRSTQHILNCPNCSQGYPEEIKEMAKKKWWLVPLIVSLFAGLITLLILAYA